MTKDKIIKGEELLRKIKTSKGRLDSLEKIISSLKDERPEDNRSIRIQYSQHFFTFKNNESRLLLSHCECVLKKELGELEKEFKEL
jgi:hypothetical protein